jgi:hypothetical protein
LANREKEGGNRPKNDQKSSKKMPKIVKNGEKTSKNVQKLALNRQNSSKIKKNAIINSLFFVLFCFLTKKFQQKRKKKKKD